MTHATRSRSVASDTTIVVTCFNHQAYVEQCLESIAAQTYPPVQVIVVDDRSNDDSANIIERWLAATGQNYTFIRHTTNVGACASLNEALALTEGRYFCHVSADDWQEPDRLERQIPAFDRAHPSAALIVSDIREVDAGGSTIVDHDFGKRLGHMTGSREQPQLLSRLLEENVIPAPGVTLRTDVIREIGGYDETLVFEDYDMWLRLATRYSLAYEPGIVANYRVVESSLFRSPDRRVSVLSSEADMLMKHVGHSPADDKVIVDRILKIARDVLELGASTSFRRILALASSASDELWIKSATRTAQLPGGLALLKRHYGVRLGLSD